MKKVLPCGLDLVFAVSSRVCKGEIALDGIDRLVRSFIVTVISTVW
jgi:hypothetical protein